MTRSKSKMDKSKIWLLAILFPFFLFIQVIHELAHWSVGTFSGMECVIAINIISGSSCVCFGVPTNLPWFYASGGLVAAIVAVAPLTIRTVRRYKPFLICSISVSFSELVCAAAETFDHTNYMSESLFYPVLLNSIFVILFITLTVKMLGHKNSQSEMKSKRR